MFSIRYFFNKNFFFVIKLLLRPAYFGFLDLLYK